MSYTTNSYEHHRTKRLRTNTNTYDGDAFIVDIDNARYALSLDEHVREIWLTNRKNKYNANDKKNRSFLDKKNRLFLNKKRKSFITLWISEALGEELGKRSKQMVDYTSDKEIIGELREEGAINSRQISLDRGSSGLTVIRLIIVDTENSGVLRDGKVEGGMVKARTNGCPLVFYTTS
ncbi:hypothetical protein G7Y89_g1900 [Cudoniella acicularis]|uniref:Uncharacterized protein n=1 Tax=Cudoniella acicularis TaxID=354080 RepID=A0A8H4W6K0_9HELO|nr:hypothetical protein G7Y89_g1900 [Cudoniella acicularis]